MIKKDKVDGEAIRMAKKLAAKKKKAPSKKKEAIEEPGKKGPVRVAGEKVS